MDIGLFFFYFTVVTTFSLTLYFARRVGSFSAYVLGSGEHLGRRMTPFVGSLSMVVLGQGLLLLLNFVKVVPFFFQLLYALFLIVALFWLSSLVLQIEEFLGSLSVAELLGKCYGRRVRAFVALLGLFFCLGGLALQCRLGNYFLHALFGEKGKWILLTFLLLIGLHALASGWEFVLLANFFQLLLIVACLPLIIWTINYAGIDHLSWEQLWDKVGWPQLFIHQSAHPWLLLRGYLLLALQPILLIFSPLALQHAFARKNLLKVQRIYFLSSCLLIALLLLFLGLESYAHLFGGRLGELHPFIAIIRKHTVYFSRIILIVAALLTLFVGVCSYLHSASVMIGNDFFRSSIQKESTLIVARVGGLVLLLGAFFLGVHPMVTGYHLISLQYLYLGVVPLFLVVTLYGFRTTRIVFFAALLVGPLILFLLELYSFAMGSPMLGLFVAGGINCLFLLLLHQITQKKGGWSNKKTNWSLLAYQQSYGQKLQRLKEQILKLDLKTLLTQNTPRRAMPYFLFASYGLSFVVGLFYLLDPLHLEEPYLEYLLYTAVAWAILLILFSAFHLMERYRLWAGLVWYMSLFYLFFILVPGISLLTAQKEIILTLFCCNILFASLMVNWRVLLFMVVGGGLLGREAIRYSFPGQEKIYFNFLLQPQNFLLIFLGWVLMVIILQQKAALKRQKRSTQLFKHAYQANRYASLSSELAQSELGSSLKERVALPFAWVEQHLGDFSAKGAQNKRLESIRKTLQKGSNYLNRLIQNLQGEKMDVKLYDLNTLLAEWKELVDRSHSSLMVVIRNRAKHLTLQVDKGRFFSLLNELLTSLALEKKKYHAFVLYLDNTELHYELPERKVLALIFSLQPTQHAMPKLLKSYNFREHTAIFSAVKNRQSLLYRLLDIVYAHCGTVYRKNEASHWQVVLPINLKILRPNIQSYKKVEPAPIFRAEDYASAWHAESRFRAALSRKEYNFEQIEQAIVFMKQQHAPQQRFSGEPFHLHLFQVAIEVSKYSEKEDTIVAALLHDALQGTLMTLLDIYLLFGKKVAHLVDQVTKLNSRNRRYRLDKDALGGEKVWKRMDREAILIKLCDRVHNLETLNHLPPIKQQRILEETRKVYLDLANQFEWSEVKNKIEKLLAKVLPKLSPSSKK